MKVDFFLTNTPNTPTAPVYLFSKERISVMNDEYIEHEGQFYQVTGQLIAQEPGAAHNAFVSPVNFEKFQTK